MRLKGSIVGVPWPLGSALGLCVTSLGRSPGLCTHVVVAQAGRALLSFGEVKGGNHREGTNLLSLVSDIPLSVMCLALPRDPCGQKGLASSAGHILPGFLVLTSVWLCLLEKSCSHGSSYITKVDRAFKVTTIKSVTSI